MTYTPEDEEEPPQLRRLRLLVMALIVVLMLGIVTIAATIVIRLGFPSVPVEPVPVEALTIPKAHEVIASGQGPGTVHLTLRGPDGVEALYVFDAETGKELSRTTLTRN
jgi:hypothetical protein